MIQGAAVWPAI